MDPTQAGAQLGELLFGGRNPDQSAYYKQLALAGGASNAMANARKNRALALITEGKLQAIPQLGHAATDLGFTPDQAAGYQTLGQAGGGNASQLTTALGDILEMDQRRAAQHAALSGDLNAANANLMGVAKGPVTLTRIAGGEAYNPIAAPGTAPTVTTPLGEADIGLRHAQAGANTALGDMRTAHANLYDTQTASGGYNPNTGGKNKLPPISDIAAVIGKEFDPATYHETLDPAKVQQVYAWFAQHPGATMADYVANAPVGSPGAVAPTGTINLGELSVPAASASVARPLSTAMPLPTVAVPPGAVLYLRQHAADPAIREAFRAKYGADPAAYLAN